MPKVTPKVADSEMLEDLASEMHEIWVHWMKYLMPKVKVKASADEFRWKNQMKTKYKDLGDKEKQSDRDQAVEILSVFMKHVEKIAKKVK